MNENDAKELKRHAHNLLYVENQQEYLAKVQRNKEISNAIFEILSLNCQKERRGNNDS